jgi:hypothetical protein
MTIEGFKITSIFKGPKAIFDVDTCPERVVILRLWNPPDVRLVPCTTPDGKELSSYELDPEEALKLSDKLRRYAHLVMVRDIMTA